MGTPTDLHADADALAATADGIAATWERGLADAIAGARGIGLDGPALTPDNLAWAVAWLVDDAGRRETAFARIVERAGSMDGLRDQLTAPLPAAAHGDDSGLTPLGQLARSVACEQRPDWHAPPVATALAAASDAPRAAFDRLCARHGDAVVRACRGFAGPDAEEIAAEAWAGVFTSYWSPQSRGRFTGSSRITTLVITAARRLAWRRRSDAGQEPVVEPVAAALGMASVDREDLRLAFEGCRDALPPRQRLFVALLLQQGLRRSQIADVTGTTRPNVTGVLDRALLALRVCLETKGFGSDPEVAS